MTQDAGGRLLRVNLSTGSFSQEAVPQEVREQYIGGKGFGIYYLFRELPSGVEPLGPENKLALVAGPLNGTTAQSFSRWIAMAKSPMTGAIGRAVGGGDFGAWLKFAGFDVMLIEGRASRPSYIYWENGHGEVLDAGDLWGHDTEETQVSLASRHGPRTRSACIGPAGENLVRYAAIVCGRRTASRCGMGTVMGSKNLKAVAINVPRQVEVARATEFSSLVKQQIEAYKPHPVVSRMNKAGTTYAALVFHNMGLFPVCNFQRGRLAGIEKLAVDEFAKVKVGNFGCYSCLIKCGQMHQVKDGAFAGHRSEGPEYETIWALGGNLGITERDAVIAADSMCDLLGLDTISTGLSLSFAYELYQRGLLKRSQTDGEEMTWGNHQAMLRLVQSIAHRKGLGKLLGEGSLRAARTLGNGAEYYAMQVKGLELGGYEPRAAKGQGLAYAVSPIGGSHSYARSDQEIAGDSLPRVVDRFADEGKGDVIAFNHWQRSVGEAAISCIFASRATGRELTASLLAAVTGIDRLAGLPYLEKVGQRIATLERLFNIRHGFGRNDDTLPRRMTTEPLEDAGPATGQVVRKLDTLLDEYYDAMGFSRQGLPTADTLRELGLAWTAGFMSARDNRQR
ncbi:MAG: aldehyde ferredoxin oxidoreductase family protein [Chloroflexi bacterium]|nr:aldehyde ferredoxin oxidoreductase family protein [Chloroflexota bacterium]